MPSNSQLGARFDYRYGEPHNKFFQWDQSTPSRLLLAQQARQDALAAEEKR
jgi:hypothetical protein